MRAETDEIVDVCIVGAGMAGLVVAAETAAAGLRTVVVDASDRVGGMLAPVMIAGGAGVGAAGGQVAADAGAESFATRTTGVTDLIDRWQLPVTVTAPNPAGAWLVAQSVAGGAQIREHDLREGAEHRFPCGDLVGLSPASIGDHERDRAGIPRQEGLVQELRALAGVQEDCASIGRHDSGAFEGLVPAPAEADFAARGRQGEEAGRGGRPMPFTVMHDHDDAGRDFQVGQ